MKSTPAIFGTVALGTLTLGALALGTPRAEDTAPKGKAPAKPTYASDVAPILNARCVECHRPGEVAPFSLVGYENAKKWSGMTANVTEKGIMPPWKAAHGYGEFQGENRLTEVETATLRNWHNGGAPRGDRKKEPAPPKFSSDWTLGTPDLIISPSKPYKLDAEGADVYRNFVIRTDHKEPIWVKAIDVRPGNKKVVHHVIAFLDEKGASHELEKRQNDGQEGYITAGGGTGFIPSGALGGWAPGVRARRSPDGTAFKLYPGTTIVMQVHYHKSGKPEEDKTQLGLYFAKEPIEREMFLHWVFNFNLNIPPGAKEHKMTRTYTYGRDETIYSVMPHMHLIGKSMKSWLEYPDGTTKPLVHVDKWDFNWQLVYALKEPIKVPAGTKQHIEAIYDNSADNPYNPNTPPKPVRWGEETTDEMFLMITAFTVDKK
ncbi:MAG: ascorbate-dependent monooxygenase [Fimbriimonas sp.]